MRQSLTLGDDLLVTEGVGLHHLLGWLMRLASDQRSEASLAWWRGKYVLRAVLQPALKRGGKWPRLLSGPVEIEVLPGQYTVD